MKTNQKSTRRALWLFAVLVLAFLLTQTGLGMFLFSSPWWVYVVMIGIVVSGYFSLKYTLEDKRYEQEWIESEGKVYLERMEAEKERRNHMKEAVSKAKNTL